MSLGQHIGPSDPRRGLVVGSRAGSRRPLAWAQGRGREARLSPLGRLSSWARSKVCDSGAEMVSPALTGARPHPSPSPSVATDCVASSRQHHRLRLVPISLPRLSIGSGTKGLHRAPARAPTCPSARASAGCTTAAPPRAPPWSRRSSCRVRDPAHPRDVAGGVGRSSGPASSRRRCCRLRALALSWLTALSTMALAAKRAPERVSRSSWPLACNSSKRPASGSPADALGRGHGGSRRSANRQAQSRCCGERCMVQF